MDKTEKLDYEGKQGALYLRVSDKKQEKMYGFVYQERQSRALADQLGITIKFVIKDAYTGMEFRERPELTTLRNMAKRREFEVVLMWKLDRLGRKGIQREIVREELKYHGVTILTTDPDEHADDDSPLGEVIRAMYSFKAEQERNDLILRTTSGKRERAMEGKLLGTGFPLYGYKWRSEKPQEKDAYVLNLDVILVEPDGTEWTEVKVVCVVFDLADSGMPIRAIAKYLNDKGIPTRKGTMWQPATIHQMLCHPFYTGEAAMFKRKDTEKKAGHKQPTRIIRPEEEQIKMPEGVVPAIIDKALFERVQMRLERNKREAPRNNKNPQESLLRSGFAKCGYCGGNTHFRRHIDRFGPGKDWCFYVCTKGNSGRFGTCQGCSIAAHTLDDAAWEAALEIIHDPSQADKKVETLRAQDDPSVTERTSITNKIARIEQQQKVLRKRLKELELDKDTEQWLSKELRDLAAEKKRYEDELKTSEDVHEKWKQLQTRLAEFHQRCQKWRENVDDPEFTPSYAFKRDAIDFFGITAIIWKQDHKPHYKIRSDPPSIVSLLSCGC